MDKLTAAVEFLVSTNHPCVVELYAAKESWENASNNVGFEAVRLINEGMGMSAAFDAARAKFAITTAYDRLRAAEQAALRVTANVMGA